MKLNLTAYFGYGVTAVLLLIAGYFSSFPFAYASVLALVVTLAHESFDRFMDQKLVKAAVLPDEAKRKIQDLEARVTSIEVGIQRRGF